MNSDKISEDGDCESENVKSGVTCTIPYECRLLWPSRLVGGLIMCTSKLQAFVAKVLFLLSLFFFLEFLLLSVRICHYMGAGGFCGICIFEHAARQLEWKIV